MKSPWPEVPLGEVLDEAAVLSGEQPIIAKIRFSDGIIGLRASGETKTNLISICPGDLILSGINAAKGAIAIYEPPYLRKAAATIHYSSYIIDKKKVEPRFLWMLLRHGVFRESLEQYVPNGIKTELKAKRFLPIPVPLPPLPEQRRLVAKLDQITSRVEEAKKLFSSVQDEAGNLLGAMISDILSDLYFEGTLKDVLHGKPRNGWSPKCDGAENGVAVLSLSAVYRFIYDSSALKKTSEKVNHDAHYWLQPGDLLMSRSNSIDLVGNAAIYNGDPSPCIYPDLLMKLRVNSDDADLRFVHYWLQSRTVRQYIRKHAKGTSPSMKKISQGIVMAIPWPRGLSVAEQQKYVRRFEEYNRAILRLQPHHHVVEQELEALMPALLDQAFRGEL